MMKISGRFRQTSIHTPAATLTILCLERRRSASMRPKQSDSVIATSAIWMLIQKPVSRKRKLFPEKSQRQFSGSNR